MNSKKFGLFIGVTIVVLLLAIYANQKQQADLQSNVAGQALYPQLSKQLNDVNEVVVESSAGLVNIHRNGERWLVKQRNDYPADMGKLKQVILGLADMKLIEAKTQRSESYSKLGIEEPTEENSKNLRVILKSGENELASIIIGNERSGSGGASQSRYVRKSGDAQSWLVKTDIAIDKEAQHWLDDTLADIKAERIRSIQYKQADGKSMTITKNQFDAKDYSVLALPKDKEINSQSTVNNLATALQSLTLQDVVPATAAKTDSKPNSTEIQTYDGLVIRINSYLQDGQTLNIFEANFDANARIAETDENKDKLKSADDVKKEAEALQAQWQPWAYVLSSTNINKLNKKLADISRDIKK